MSIVAFPAAPRDPQTPHESFCLARRAMLRALREWIQSGADSGDVAEEIAGTAKAVEMMVVTHK